MAICNQDLPTQKSKKEFSKTIQLCTLLVLSMTTKYHLFYLNLQRNLSLSDWIVASLYLTKEVRRQFFGLQSNLLLDPFMKMPIVQLTIGKLGVWMVGGTLSNK